MEVVKPANAINKRTSKFKKAILEAEEALVQGETIDNKDSNSEEKTNVKFTENINLDVNKEESNTHKVNFMDEGAMESMLDNPTQESPEENKAESKKDEKNDINGKTEDIKPVESGAFTTDDMKDFAEVFMDIIDMGISTVLKFYSGDSSSYFYELGADKKKRLVRQLTNLLMKYQMKFSLEFMFIVTLLICYSVPFSNARKTRLEIKAGTFKRASGRPEGSKNK